MINIWLMAFDKSSEAAKLKNTITYEMQHAPWVNLDNLYN
jgi:hypothetical protein